ncbi:hypothetical protein OAL14_04945 [Gammaproteobacteria bacterium]|nr:hypothetical protein [Gammaproteobacteria bacterium]
MKLRIRGNTLRLRLSRSEVEKVEQEKMITETTVFPDGEELQYVICPSDSSTNVTKMSEGLLTRIEVSVEREVLKSWAKSEEVGLYGADPIIVGSLELLVEKDFACINPRDGSDDGDSFPHPASSESDSD